MIIIDCKSVLPVKNDLLVYVADKVEAIPTLKNDQFTLSTFDDNEILDTGSVISAIKEYLESIDEGRNFAVISNNDTIQITSVSGKIIQKTSTTQQSELFSCTHCGFVTRYQVELDVHMKIHYI